MGVLMSTPENISRWDALMRRWDRAFRWSFVVSVLLHILIVLLFRSAVLIPDVPMSAAGEDARDARAAAGGGSELIAFTIVQPPPVEEQVVPVPVPVPAEQPQPVVEQPPAPTPSQVLGQTVAAGEGRGVDTGPGIERGTGAGSGGTGDEGDSRIIAPSPRGLILPPSDRPARVRGNTVTVYVFVTERGGVVADSTRIAPSSGDTRFDTRLRRQASDWVFNPARRNGQPVAEWFRYEIVL
jgi:outer membrane biosynthesis protein TonB